MKPEPRLTGTSYAVLGLVDAWGPCTPYDLKQAIQMTLSHFWPVPHTTFYAEPARLEEAGLLSSDQEPGGRRRKHYAITDAGREALHAWVGEPGAAPPQLRDEMMLKVFLGADPERMAAERQEWHRERIGELEDYLAAVRAGEGSTGMERSLAIGIAYHRAVLGLFDGS